jgi:hypothetical protein
VTVKRVFGMFALLVVTFFLSGSCAHKKTDESGPQTLHGAVTQVWEAKVNGEWGVVYDAAVREYKERVKRGDFVKHANLNVKEYAIKDVDIRETGRKATAVVKYKVVQNSFVFEITARDEWLFEEGAWRLNLMPTLGGPMK